MVNVTISLKITFRTACANFRAFVKRLKDLKPRREDFKTGLL